MNPVFRYQTWHLLTLILLLTVLYGVVDKTSGILTGQIWGISTSAWFLMAVAAPIIHQVYVWLVWRLELYQQTFSSRFGVQRAFEIYTIGFVALFASRLIFIAVLAVSNQYSLDIEPYIVYTIALFFSPEIIYLFYSVKKYFSMERALGIDHFVKSYRKPFEKKGIFRYMDNAMYICGFLILYLPGLLLLSKAALVVAVFNHLYIWVHYFCTERPDMVEIYGKIPGE